jgi:signal transduction histidine kinase
VTRAFRRLPIRLKLISMMLATAAVVLLLASVGFLIADIVQTRGAIEQDLASQADLILQNSDAPLRFDDKDAAQATLDTLASKRDIRLACLYDDEDALFAAYRPPGEALSCGPRPPAFAREGGLNFLQLSRTGVLDGRKLGSVLIRSDLQTLYLRIRVQLGILALLLVLASTAAVAISSRLQAVVGDPVTALAATAESVSRRGDYSLRAARTTDDELGQLVDAFNRMLEQIQARESDLSRANEELRREVAERRKAEQERAALLVREREANRLKDEFLATLSHELRTPLNAILGWTKLLRANAVPPASVDRALEKVERNAQVQSRLIEDLLEVSRIVTGKLRLEQRPLDLVTVCSTAVDSIRPAAEARGVALRREFGEHSLPTIGDPDRLQQVVWNLLSNAVKFTPPGGTVTLQLRRGNGFDELTVTDTGIGIEQDFLPDVFETFRQADASSTRTHGGLGLGLSIVKQLVEMHGGEVEAASGGRDAGATFTVRLPIRAGGRRRDGGVEGAAAPDIPPGSLTGHTVLVVDDDADTRELLVTVLERAGARVLAAASAEEGVTISLERAPDAIVSDIAMPGEDGFAMMRRLFDLQGTRAPRVRVALSAFAAPGDRERALASGFQRHVPKPVDPAAFVRLLEEMLAAPAGAGS